MLIRLTLLLILLCTPPLALAGKNKTHQQVQITQPAPRTFSLLLRDSDLADVAGMLAKTQNINILLGKDVSGTVSVNLHNVSADEAVHAIADAAGFAVERRDGTYVIFKRDEAGKYAYGNLTTVRTFKVQYSKPDAIQGIIKNHLSGYGKVSMLAERKLLVVEDMPEFLDRISTLMQVLDRPPKQILIEAKILEVTLGDNESFGLDWKKMFTLGGTAFSLGMTGLNKPTTGLDFELVNSANADLVLTALRERNRLRTLSTPKLLALEDQPAEAIIGDRQGYVVTTTINQVTSQSIQFLESGVILRVTPTVDAQNRILLAIHPEVSTGKVTNGIPSQTTTEVTTNMLVGDNQTVFIGGLIKQETNDVRNGVPILGDLPVVGRLFSNQQNNVSRTETIVLITPHIVGDSQPLYDAELRARVLDNEKVLEGAAASSESSIHLLLDSRPLQLNGGH